MANETATAGSKKKGYKKLEIRIMGPVADEKGQIIEELLKKNGYKELNITDIIETLKHSKEDKYMSIILEAGGKPKQKTNKKIETDNLEK